MTLHEAYRHIVHQLQSIYEKSEASNIADWLIGHLTGAVKTNRIASRERMLEPEQEKQMQLQLDRLLHHEPVQYVLNEAWFCGLRFYVDQNVLIPRPETEELVEWVISDRKFPIDALSILDIGTGSGCIAIALKKRLNKADVWACDSSPVALEVAQRNSLALGLPVHFTELSFLDSAQRDKLPPFDVLVSNPPYIPASEKSLLPSNVLDYEPHTALFVPDSDALVFYEAIAEFGKLHLLPGGHIYAEIHEELGEAASDLFRSAGYNTELKKDMQGKLRMIRAHRP